MYNSYDRYAYALMHRMEYLLSLEPISIVRAKVVLVGQCASFTGSRRHGECIPTSHGPVNGSPYAGERPAEKGLNRTLMQLVGVSSRYVVFPYTISVLDDADLVIIVIAMRFRPLL